jgi:hypothetical protein
MVFAGEAIVLDPIAGMSFIPFMPFIPGISFISCSGEEVLPDESCLVGIESMPDVKDPVEDGIGLSGAEGFAGSFWASITLGAVAHPVRRKTQKSVRSKITNF